MGDFTGFTFGDWHSTGPETGEVIVLRTSNGDRYEEQLHPEIKDITAEVPGMDGEYYFGSQYGTKTFDIEIAFDHLTEEQFRKLRQAFGTRQLKQLIFDECPYKYYMAKIESPIELSYICFDEPKRELDTERDGVRRDRENDQEYVPPGNITDSFSVQAGKTVSFTLTRIPDGEVEIISSIEPIHEQDTLVYTFNNSEGNTDVSVEISYEAKEIPFEAAWEQVTPYIYDYETTERIYKGEGKISFICYFPFAKSVYKQLPTDKEDADWAISSGILSEEDYQSNYIDVFTNGTEGQPGKINIYNAGDIATGFRLYLPSAMLGNQTTITYEEITDISTASLVINPVTLKPNGKDGSDNIVYDEGILIDTTNQLILGVKEETSADGVITSGNLYNEYIDSGYFFKFEPNTVAGQSTLKIINSTENISDIDIFYNYLYF